MGCRTSRETGTQEPRLWLLQGPPTSPPLTQIISGQHDSSIVLQTQHTRSCHDGLLGVRVRVGSSVGGRGAWVVDVVVDGP